MNLFRILQASPNGASPGTGVFQTSGTQGSAEGPQGAIANGNFLQTIDSIRDYATGAVPMTPLDRRQQLTLSRDWD